MRAGPRKTGALLLLAVLLALGGCGRRNWPQAPGPPDEITFPRTYPTR